MPSYSLHQIEQRLAARTPEFTFFGAAQIVTCRNIASLRCLSSRTVNLLLYCINVDEAGALARFYKRPLLHNIPPWIQVTLPVLDGPIFYPPPVEQAFCQSFVTVSFQGNYPFQNTSFW